jgi:hypothetical protein
MNTEINVFCYRLLSPHAGSPPVETAKLFCYAVIIKRDCSKLTAGFTNAAYL